MIIKAVAYGKLFNLGNYENERVELAADLTDGDDYWNAIAALADDVQRIGEARAEARGADRDAAYKEYGAKARLERINADIKNAEAQWERAKSFLALHGVELGKNSEDDDIPF